jgi:hypothetical protein
VLCFEAVSRKSLSSSPEIDPGLLPQRRSSGARHPVTGRVSFASGETVLEGWALNESRGGVRAIVEEKVELGSEFIVTLDGKPPRPGKVVWVQEEPDGAVVGVSFTDREDGDSSVPPPEKKIDARASQIDLLEVLARESAAKKDSDG